LAQKKEFAMLQELLARWRLWEQALEGMDDPQGEYLLNLEERVRRLECEMEQLPKLPTSNAAAAGMTKSIQTLD
jgi:hypothetical protein